MRELIGVSKVVIKNDTGKVLLLLRSSTAPSRPLTWDLPGGIIEADEEALDAAVRETKEESGIDISNYDLKKLDTRKDYKFCWIVYGANVMAPKVDISWEHVEFKWVNVEELEQIKNIPDFLKKMILDAFDDSVSTN